MVVKLVITPACHAGGRGFKSLPPRQKTSGSSRSGWTLFALWHVALLSLQSIICEDLPIETGLDSIWRGGITKAAYRTAKTNGGPQGESGRCRYATGPLPHGIKPWARLVSGKIEFTRGSLPSIRMCLTGLFDLFQHEILLVRVKPPLFQGDIGHCSNRYFDS